MDVLGTFFCYFITVSVPECALAYGEKTHSGLLNSVQQGGQGKCTVVTTKGEQRSEL